MVGSTDNYEIYYADKLWKLLPAIYRTLDTDEYDSNGPLREMVNRIGVQAAIVRRSIDRMWEDQSIETCDDWVISYIADLLATNLVTSLDARGQRLDVAKTIYYRRRKGTVAILEEIAADITGWNARVVEFFRRLGRTRHNLDPAIGLPLTLPAGNPGDPRELQIAEGLVGSWTHTGIGGWADLRNNYGASKTGSAFDEYYHTADFRRGHGRVGWYGISRLGVFLWRLYSFPLELTTPVRSQSCHDHYTFDPTGREIPLFAVEARSYGDAWVSPAEWQLPTPISQPLLQADRQFLYATPAQKRSLGIFDAQGNLIPADQVTADPNPALPNVQFFIDPAHGKLIRRNTGPVQFLTTYTYGFSSKIGAGPYDRRVIGEKSVEQPSPITHVSAGGGALINSLATLGTTGTIVIDDSLTYTSVSNLPNVLNIALTTKNETRSLIRLPVPAPTVTEWVFTGADEAQSILRLDGLFVSGGDIVLKGGFKHVTITCCTFDPGDAAEVTTDPTNNLPKIYTLAADGRDLLPCRLWIEAQIQQLTIERSIVGPIRTRAQGSVEVLTLRDCIMQAIRSDDSSSFTKANLRNPGALAVLLRDAKDPLSTYVQGQFPAEDLPLLSSYDGLRPPSPALLQAILQVLNNLLSDPLLYDANRFAGIPLTPETLQWITQSLTGAALVRLNRWLLQEAYPTVLEGKDSVLALSNGEVHLSRCTLLGPAYVHRLSASECILNDIVLVEDVQHGCVRFSACASGSVLPRRYESVDIVPKAPLFTASRFGQPDYAQLLSSVDGAILSGSTGATISAGAQDGSEMGVFAREKNPVKERSLLIKYEEYMPLGLVPVIIYVT